MLSDVQSVVKDKLYETARSLSYDEAEQIDSFEEPVKLFKRWQALPGDVPHHRNIKAHQFEQHILPSFYILDVIPEHFEDNTTGDVDFQFRLFGTANTDNYGKEGTAKRLSDMSHDGSGAGFDITKHAYHTASAQFLLCEYHKNNKHVKTGSLVIMPLSDDSGAIVRMFGCAIWTTPE